MRLTRFQKIINKSFCFLSLSLFLSLPPSLSAVSLFEKVTLETFFRVNRAELLTMSRAGKKHLSNTETDVTKMLLRVAVAAQWQYTCLVIKSSWVPIQVLGFFSCSLNSISPLQICPSSSCSNADFSRKK